jgi:S-layer protein
MGTKLDDGDTITGGSATTDALSATVNGLTATTGKLNITGVEAIELLTATAASTIDASLISGVTEIQITGDGTAGGDGSQNVTFTNLAAGVEIGLGSNTSAGADGYKATAAIGLADATSSSDTVTVNLGARNTNADITATLTGTGIETLKLVDSATAKDSTVNVNGFAATTLDIDGGKAGELLDLSGAILNAATTTVDASGFLGTLTASAATNTATTFTATAAVGTLTGGASGDTFTIGSTANFLNASPGTVAGGAGADTLNVFAGGSSFDLDAVTAVETINITFDDVAGFNIGAGGGSDATITAATVTYAGGKSGEVYGSGSTGVLTDVASRVIDASDLLGSIEISFGDDGLVVTNVSDPVTITGGQSAVDVVNIAMTNSNTGTFTMSGVEKLVAGNITGASTIDLTNVTGLSDVTLHNSGGTGTNFTLSAVATGTTVTLGDAGDEFDDQTVDINLADATGTSDALTVNLVDTDDQSSTATIDADGIETVTLALANSNEKHTVAMQNNLTASTVIVTGTDVDADLTLSSIEAGITTVNASGLAGELTIADTARGSDAMTITGGTGADTIEMENAADVLTGGAGATISDEVQVTFSGTGGAIVVDLSSTTDQVTLFNGVANSAAQTGFEDIDVSGYTQTGSVGADITGTTGANVIVGTGYADTIRGGEGADTITGGAGNDTITTGAGADTIAIASADGTDTVTDFTAGTGGDKFAATGLEAITTEDTTFAKLTAGATTYDVGVTAGIVTAAVDVAAAASMAASDVNTLLKTTLGETISAADDGEKAILIVSTDFDAEVDSYMYIIEHDGTDIDGVTLLGTLKSVELDNLSAANFDGFA